MDETKIIMLIARIHEKANAFLMEELSSHDMEGLVPSHGDILFLLFLKGSLAMNEIATLINRTKPTVTVLVDKLVDHGYVEKIGDPDDNRVTRISLTARGRSMKSNILEISGNLIKRTYGKMKKDDRLALCALLEQVHNNL